MAKMVVVTIIVAPTSILRRSSLKKDKSQGASQITYPLAKMAYTLMNPMMGNDSKNTATKMTQLTCASFARFFNGWLASDFVLIAPILLK